MSGINVLYYDCYCGISGDMHLGAMIDAGVDSDFLQSELNKLNLDDFTLDIKKTTKSGIAGTKVDVNVKNHHSDHHRHARGYSDIIEIIETSTLSRAVKTMSKTIVTHVAEAEAAVHRTSMEKVHFHEVGAVDSIIDIVGAAICIDYVKPDRIYSSPIQLGGGFITCAHGKLPVPAPATAELLKNAPVRIGLVDQETTTPTGAAIIAAVVDEYTEKQEISIQSIGYGFGTRELPVPNALRVFIGTLPAGEKQELRQRNGTRFENEENIVIETNIDDMNPERYEPLLHTLLELGAKDVFFTPIIMKKSRPAVTVSVLATPENQHKILEALFTETSTFGVRTHPVTKQMLERRERTIDTEYGEIRIKGGYLGGELLKEKPEYEDCRTASMQYGVSFSDVYDAVIKRILT